MINLTYSRQFKQNIKYKRYRQWGTRFSYGKSPQTCGDKKSWGLKPTNLNPLFEIKLHKFTWPLYPKDFLSSTYNLIHVWDTITPCCSLVDPSVSPKGLSFLTHNSNNRILKWEVGNSVAIRLFLREFLHRIRDL